VKDVEDVGLFYVEIIDRARNVRVVAIKPPIDKWTVHKVQI